MAKAPLVFPAVIAKASVWPTSGSLALTVPTSVPLALSSTMLTEKSAPALGTLSFTGVTRTVTSTVSPNVPSETEMVNVVTKSLPSSKSRSLSAGSAITRYA